MSKSLLKVAEENPALVGFGVLATAVGGILVFRKAEMKRNSHDYDSQLTGGFKILNNQDHTLKTNEFGTSISDYEGMFAGAREKTGAITNEESVAVRTERYAAMINHFYNLVTDFYEWGWCQSFHFGPRFHDETFLESIKRAEYHLCSRLGMKPGMKALDVGCGVGGPMRNMAVFSGSNIEGITINEYQVKIGNKYNEQHGLQDLCKLTKGDFQNLPWPDEHFDVAYEIEATCHSPNRVQTFAGVARVLKPGALFAGYEWVMTKNYDPNNKDHVRIKEGIEVGNGLPTLVGPAHVIDSMEKAGFEVLDHYDANRGVHAKNELPWYETLNGKMSITGFRMTHLGRLITHSMVWTLELLRIAPEGTTKVSALLNATAIDLCDGGKLEIFTPSYFFIGRKKANWKFPTKLDRSTEK
jgi:sterol 24-C-methyltransferase